MRFLKWTLAIILILLLGTVGVFFGYLKSTVADYNGEIKVKGLKEKVEIIRDSYGVPHIFAENNEDAYFAIGYATAQDRLFQMEIIRAAGKGRLSEIFGKDMVKADILYRTVFSPCDVKKVYEDMSPEPKAVLEAYVKGINHYIENMEEPLPFEFLLLNHKPGPWKPEDVISITVFNSWFFSSSFKRDLMYATFIDHVGDEMASEIFPPNREYELDYYNPSKTALYDKEGGIYENSPALAGGYDDDTSLKLLNVMGEAETKLTEIGLSPITEACNNFGISGEKSKTGMPILAHDCHIPKSIPSMFYECHMVTPTTNISGQVSVGLPVFWSGQIETAGWVYTGAFVDELDFYIERVNPENRDQYLYKGKWEDMEIKKEIIKVKGGKDVELNVRLTVHGPVVDDIIADAVKGVVSKDELLSMRWAGTDITNQFEVAYLVTEKMNDVDSFIKGFGDWGFPAAHMIVGDSNGDLGYILGAGIPIRMGFSGSLPMPGWTGEYEWQGYVSPDKKPIVKNPKKGFINSSNSRYPVPVDYPFELGNVCSSHYRALRVNEIIEETISEKGGFGMEDINKVYGDVYVVMGRDFVPLIIESLKGKELTDNEKRALEELSSWDYMSDKGEIAPAIFQATLVHMVKNSFSNRLGDDLYNEFIKVNSNVFKGLGNIMKDEDSKWFDDPDTPEIEKRGDMLAKSFRDAVKFLEKERGKNIDGWVWGEMFTLTLEHPFSKKVPLLKYFADIGPYPMSGGFIVPYATTPMLNDPYRPSGISQARHVIDCSDNRNSKVVSMPGISGNFMSPHYDDQFDMWYNFEFRTLMLYRNQVEKDAKYRLTMVPE
ncbi:MAG: penicillin acylase family protein [Deltaproteobacteria bacterium]|uniref:Penicillin acylase family protein n=1 Tax=Candidatus Zymogenus saltonus TaxID=2844893 RepID=A0A9D8PPQ8_9DELT|nr:penicillin acylase family protein [Candidatus Zymogenus saltonus]